MFPIKIYIPNDAVFVKTKINIIIGRINFITFIVAWVWSLICCCLFGVFASLYAMADDGIAGACAIHTIWNFLQGNIFGFEVSGNNMGEPLFLLGEEKANIINGGAFGAEGGLAVTVVLAIAVIIVFEKNSRNSRWIMV